MLYKGVYMNIVLLSILLMMMISYGIKDSHDRRRVESVTLVALCLQCVVFLYAFQFSSQEIATFFGLSFKLSHATLSYLLLYDLVAIIIFWFAHYGLTKNETINVYINFYRYYMMILSMIHIVVLSNHLVVISIAFILGFYYSQRLLGMKHDRLTKSMRTKYLYMNLAGIVLVILGLAILGFKTSSLTLHGIHITIASVFVKDANWIKFALVLITVGLGINGGLFPFYSWITDIYRKSWAPIVAFSSSVTVTMPAILLLRIIDEGIGLSVARASHILEIIMILGCLNLLIGSIIANHQKHVKAFLGYHTVAQIGLIYIGIGIGYSTGINVASFQVLVHATVSCALFLSIEAIIEQTDSVALNDLKGIGHEMPISLGVFTLSGLSMVGLPILPGFFSRWYLLLALIEYDYLMILGVIMFFTLMTARSLLPIIINGYFGNDNLKHRVYKSKSKPVDEVMPLIIIGIIIVLLGYFATGVMGVML